MPAGGSAQPTVQPTNLVIASEQRSEAPLRARFPRAAPAGVVIEAIEVARVDGVRSGFASAGTAQTQGQLTRLSGKEDLVREREGGQCDRALYGSTVQVSSAT
jgi:hypothetical protein